MTLPDARSSLNTMSEKARRRLEEVGCSTPELDVRLLAAWVLGVTVEQTLMLGPDPVDEAIEHRFWHAIKQRADGRSVARITGTRGFWSLDLLVSAETLEPRPDTEILVDAILRHLGARDRVADPLVIVDVGTGTGALVLALLSEFPNAIGLGIDMSAGALETARVNAVRHNLSDRVLLVRADYLTSIDLAEVDILVSNPPYIPTAAVSTLDVTVRDHDPRLALDGGVDGLVAYRCLSECLQATPPRIGAWLEIGADQSQDVSALFDPTQGRIQILSDLAGHSRCVEFIPHYRTID